MCLKSLTEIQSLCHNDITIKLACHKCKNICNYTFVMKKLQFKLVNLSEIFARNTRVKIIINYFTCALVLTH